VVGMRQKRQRDEGKKKRNRKRKNLFIITWTRSVCFPEDLDTTLSINRNMQSCNRKSWFYGISVRVQTSNYDCGVLRYYDARKSWLLPVVPIVVGSRFPERSNFGAWEYLLKRLQLTEYEVSRKENHKIERTHLLLLLSPSSFASFIHLRIYLRFSFLSTGHHQQFLRRTNNDHIRSQCLGKCHISGSRSRNQPILTDTPFQRNHVV